MIAPALGTEWGAGDEMVEEAGAVLKECAVTPAKHKSSRLSYGLHAVPAVLKKWS